MPAPIYHYIRNLVQASTGIAHHVIDIFNAGCVDPQLTIEDHWSAVNSEIKDSRHIKPCSCGRLQGSPVGSWAS